jgi:hypothetical protein
MHVRGRWLGVPVSEIADRCGALGMRDEVADLVKRAQDGRRLVPEKAYRDYRFNQPVD